MAADLKDQPVVYVSFSAEINPNTTESLIATLTNCANEHAKSVYLMLSTPGGSVMNGMNLYNVLRAMPFELVTHNVGNVDSIGNLVFLAGAKRYASPHSTFMFHGVGFSTEGNRWFDQKYTREKLLSIEADQKRIGAIIEERTQLQDAQVRELFLEAQTKDATFAVGCGIVDEIRDVNVPSGVPVLALVFQR